jgi:hypothetical protein
MQELNLQNKKHHNIVTSSELTNGRATTAEMQVKFPWQPTESTGTYGFIPVARIYRWHYFNVTTQFLYYVGFLKIFHIYSATVALPVSHEVGLSTGRKYNGTSNFEHNPFQETIRLSSYSSFELNFPIWNNVNWINSFGPPKFTQYFKWLFKKIILVNNDKTSRFNFNNWMFLFIIVYT